MRIAGAGERTPEASGLLETRTSYLRGPSSDWQRDVPSFRRITYSDVARGVREVFHDEEGALEYDLEVSPGASAGSIELVFDGARVLGTDEGGSLRLSLGGSTIVQPPPRLYTRANGERAPVRGSYRVTARGTVTFDVGEYDASKTLVIDPVLAYSTFLGGSGDDFAYGIAVDAQGAMYVTGFTSSVDFPLASAYQGSLTGTFDAFVVKIRPDGRELEYATYLGGESGSYGYGIAVDATGAAYVVGSTDSSQFPTKNAAQPTLAGGLDAFVAKLAPSGDSLVYSTFLGGSLEDTGTAIAIDGTFAVYVVGTTSGDGSSGPRFPVVAAPQPSFGGTTDAFVTKLTRDGSAIEYSTYVGGSAGDSGQGIGVDELGNAYITGYTSSLDFPVVPSTTAFQSLLGGNVNAFVVSIHAGGERFVYSTFLGGSEADQGSAIAVDGVGNAYVTGFATSFDFPTKAPYQRILAAKGGGSNAFVTKVLPTGTALAYSTFLGGEGVDIGASIAIDSAGAAYVTGTTASLRFPTVLPIQSENASSPMAMGTNAFFSELAPDGQSLIESTYLGGSVGDSAESVSVGPAGAYLAGYTVSSDFPIEGALEGKLASNGGDNAFVAVIGDMRLSDAGPGARDAELAVDATALPPNQGDASEPTPDAGGRALTTAMGDGCSFARARARARRPRRTSLDTVSLLGLFLFPVARGLRRRRRERSRRLHGGGVVCSAHISLLDAPCSSRPARPSCSSRTAPLRSRLR
jgi:hypothetical protein